MSKLHITANLAAENLALRQQLIVLKRKTKCPSLEEGDRLFWVFLSRIWPDWRDALLIVKPDTVVRWQKKAFKAYWRCKSEKGKRGRPSLDPEIRAIVLKMANANPLWGAPKIHGELLKSALLSPSGPRLGCCADTNGNRPLRPGELLTKITCQIWLA